MSVDPPFPYYGSKRRVAAEVWGRLGRSSALYGSDLDGTSDRAAVESFRWAVEHGDRFRIAYCAHEGDFPIPDGWDTVSSTFGGIRDPDRRTRRDLIMFSPACKPPPQRALFS